MLENAIENREAEKQAFNPPENILKMYTLPGEKDVTHSDIKKYMRAKETFGSYEDTTDIINKALDSINKALDSGDIEVQRKAVEMIRGVPEEKQAELINKALDSGDIEVQRGAVEMIWGVPEEKQAELREKVFGIVSKHLDSGDIEVQRRAVEIIWDVPEEKKKELLNKSKNINGGHFIIESPLYNKYSDEEMNEKKFSRKPFMKTGSETTLIGGKLKDRVIVRHIKESAFKSWQKAYESYDVWQKNGFDYVPVEPIYSFRRSERKQGVDVFTGVLDISLENWRLLGKDFYDELKRDMNKIEKVLDVLDIRHGHMHQDNFVLKFFVNPNGSVDFTKKPRIYVIDFDQAKS